jgi:hypothetical protein
MQDLIYGHLAGFVFIIVALFACAGIADALGHQRLRYRAFAILIGFDVLANALTGGGKYQTISCRIGLSIERGGWASKIPWPKWWIEHCEQAVFIETL